MRILSFTVYGVAQPQGSSRAFMRPGWRHPVITSANSKNKPWRQEVSQTATATMAEMEMPLIDRPCAVRVEATFYFKKPKSAKKPEMQKVTKPDVDKLARSILDGMSGIVFEDDSQVSQCWVNKMFGSPSRAEIKVTAIGELECDVPSLDAKPIRGLMSQQKSATI